MKSIRVVMLAHDHLALTKRAVDALLRQADGFDVEVVLVDEAGSYEAADPLVDKGIDVTLHIEPGFPEDSFSSAANRATLGAETDYLLFLDNDTELQPGALKTLVEAMGLEPKAAVVGPKLVFPDGDIDQAGQALPLWLEPIAVGRYARHDDHRFGFPRKAFAVSSSCMLVRREAFEQAGGFHEGYRWGCEAINLSMTLCAAGWGVLYESRATCLHEGGATLNESPEKPQFELNRRRLLSRWGSPLLAKVSKYLEQLMRDDGSRRFYIYGTGRTGKHLARTLEIGGYEVAGFVTPPGHEGEIIDYPSWNVIDAPLTGSERVLIGTANVRDAENDLARAGLLEGAVLPILVE